MRSPASSGSSVIRPGRPPRHTSSATRPSPEGRVPEDPTASVAPVASSSGASAAHSSPSSSPPSETAPVESPDSNRDIGRIRNLATRPAPLWSVRTRAGSTEPVRMNWPLLALSSHAWRIAFHRPPARCHSSSRRGVGPARNDAGSISSRSRAVSSSSKRTSLVANRLPVHVLPHARGPSTTTAGAVRSMRSSCASTTRGRYPDGVRGDEVIPQNIADPYRKI